MTDLRFNASNVIGHFFPRATRLQRHALKMICLIPLVLLCALAPDAALAQVDTNFKAADTSSPRDTLKSFIAACNEINRLGSGAKFFDRYDPGNSAVIERAIDCIDQTEFPAFAREERAAEIAACLKEILDRTDLPPWEEIPDSADIKAAGGDEKLTHYRIPDTRITIAKVEQGDRRHEYLFSPGTADRAMKYFKSIQTKPYRTDPPEVSENLYRWFVSAPGHPAVDSTVKRLPEFLRQGETWGTANWKWLGLAVMLLIALIGIWVAYRLHIYFTNRAQEKNLFLYWLTIGFPIVATLIPLGFKFASYRYLNLRSGPLYLVDFVSIAIALVAALVVIFAASNRISASVIASPSINPAGLNAQLIRIISKLASLAASVVLFLYGGQYLGIPIGTLLASAGIGGIAVALGAQDSLRTLFGTLSLLANKPFRVGERIVFDQYDGVVEDVGLQTCRVRLFNGNQLSVPNDKLAGSDIENVGRRKYIQRVGLIHIPLDSSFEKVERAAAIIREELADHEGMTTDHPPRVYIDDITPEAYTIKFYYWFSPPNFWDFKAFSEKVNISILRKFEAEGIQLSLPSRHALWKTDNEQGPLEVDLVDDPAQP